MQSLRCTCCSGFCIRSVGELNYSCSQCEQKMSDERQSEAESVLLQAKLELVKWQKQAKEEPGWSLLHGEVCQWAFSVCIMIFPVGYR